MQFNPPEAVMAASVISLDSLIVIFVPDAVTVLKLFVALPSVILPFTPVPFDTKFAVPPTVRLPPACEIGPPETSVRFVPRVALARLIGAVFTIAPVEALPIVSVPAVMLLISADESPRLLAEPGPPRFTPFPYVIIVALPEVVALTVPERFIVLASKLIAPPFDQIFPPALT